MRLDITGLHQHTRWWERDVLSIWFRIILKPTTLVAEAADTVISLHLCMLWAGLHGTQWLTEALAALLLSQLLLTESSLTTVGNIPEKRFAQTQPKWIRSYDYELPWLLSPLPSLHFLCIQSHNRRISSYLTVGYPIKHRGDFSWRWHVDHNWVGRQQRVILHYRKHIIN